MSDTGGVRRSPKVLVACEFSGVVRDEFIRAGCNAVSCDMLPSERPGPHIQGNVIFELGKQHSNGWNGWDAMIAFPPCTHLAVSGARWFKQKQAEQEYAIFFFRQLCYANIPHIAIENPVGIMSTHYRKPDQIIQPWQFGHGETKATCLWLKGLPLLQPTNIVPGREGRIWRMPPGPDRARERSRTYPGIAVAMARQWGTYLCAATEEEGA